MGKKKRYYEEYAVFSIGRGLFQVHEADGKYWRKDPIVPNSDYGACSSCCFRGNMHKGSCAMLACHSDERKDGKEVVFERI